MAQCTLSHSLCCIMSNLETSEVVYVHKIDIKIYVVFVVHAMF